MALDTKDKRIAVMEWDDQWEPGLPDPDGSFSQQDRQQLLLGMPTNPWDAPLIPSQRRSLINIDMFGITGPYPKPGNTMTAAQRRRHIAGLYPFVIIPDTSPGIPDFPDEYFKSPTNESLAKSVASELPDGRAWQAKSIADKLMYGLVYAGSGALNTVLRLFETIAREMNINTTLDLLPEWEESVGLPDSRLEQSSPTTADRRTNVIQRLSKNPIVKIGEIQDLIDATLPNSGIWLSTTQAIAGFRYDFRYDLGSAYGERQKFVILVNTPEFALDQISWENLLSWFEDFGQGGVLWLQNTIEKNQSYAVITYPTNYQTIYAEQDEAMAWGSIDVHWKQIDKLNTVVNVIDEETITDSTTTIERSFTDSDSVLIETETTPTVKVL